VSGNQKEKEGAYGKAEPGRENVRLPTDLIPGEISLEREIDPAEAELGSAKETISLSQWQLIRLRFGKHRLAVVSFLFLIFIYVVAAMAEFFSPYDAQWSDTRYIYAPPQLPKISWERGIHVDQLQRFIDPITLKNDYQATGDYVPLGFFVKSEPYRLLGFIPGERRFFGVRTGAWEAMHPNDTGSDHCDSLYLETPPTWYFLGADKYGRDVFSRLMFGARISLSIGLVAIVVMFFLGAIIGGISGYVGGVVDNLIQRGIEIINAFPQLPLWLAFVALLPPDWSPLKTYFAITVVLSLLGWTGLGRVVRGKILSLREEDYAVAARLLGASHFRVIFRHLIPGFTSHIIVTLTLSVPVMILGETALSFLGLGLRPPVVSWGVMLQDCMSMDVIGNYPWLLMPVILIILTVLAFNFVGDGMRDAADPYSSK
jgi:peptide/nickel transport system permease protein